MNITLQDMHAALKGQMRADEAIFFFCLFWNSGPDSDLYRALSKTDFDPRLRVQQQITNDPEILYCHELLKDMYEKVYGPLREFPLRPFRLADIKENDVVTHGPGRPFVCIEANWPCRVFVSGGKLGVPCSEDISTRYFHPFKTDADGYVIGFQR